MGAGKSTIGRHLAQMLHLEFHDSDQEIESRTGADIAWVFDVEGEEGFRIRETQVVAWTMASDTYREHRTQRQTTQRHQHKHRHNREENLRP